MTKFVVAAAFLGLNFYVYHFLATDEVHPARPPLSSFPTTLADWHCAQPERMTPEIEKNLGVTDYVICTYQKESARPREIVGLYVGYHASQVRKEGGGSGENAIHPPKHCLPGSGWDIIDSRPVLLDVPGLPQRPASVNRFVIAKGTARQVVYYWYQSNGRVIASDYLKILYTFLDRARRGRTDGALVRFTVPILRNDEERADQNFREFASAVVPLLGSYIPE